MASESKKLFFFIPREKSRQPTVIHRSCMRLARNLLSKSRNGMVTVPIEALEFIAVIKDDRLYFAETEKRNNTGRLGLQVCIGWEPHLPENEDTAIQHLPMDLVLYKEGQELNELQQKLTGELYRAMMLLDQQYSGQFLPSVDIEIARIESLS